MQRTQRFTKKDNERLFTNRVVVIKRYNKLTVAIVPLVPVGHVGLRIK